MGRSRNMKSSLWNTFGPSSLNGEYPVVSYPARHMLMFLGQPRTYVTLHLAVNIYADSQTVHIDDLSRNFAMNPGEGLKVSPSGLAVIWTRC